VWRHPQQLCLWSRRGFASPQSALSSYYYNYIREHTTETGFAPVRVTSEGPGTVWLCVLTSDEKRWAEQRHSAQTAAPDTGRGLGPRIFFIFFVKNIKIVHLRGIYVNFVGHFTRGFLRCNWQLLRCLAWMRTMMRLTNHGIQLCAGYQRQRYKCKRPTHSSFIAFTSLPGTLNKTGTGHSAFLPTSGLEMDRGATRRQISDTKRRYK